jgi:hypothetical protein
MMPAKALTFAYGSYVGNGTDGHTILGLSFSPDVVIVKGAGATQAYIKTTSLGGTSSKAMASLGAYSSTGIKSLTSSGFTLGTSSSVNNNGSVYYFVAFDDDADVAVGSYAGDNSSDNPITVGFTPEMVLIYSNDVLYEPGYSTSVMGSDVTSSFNTGGLWAFGIKSLDANGFSAGSKYTYSGYTYHYVAFNAASNAYMRLGSYAGSASDKTVTVTGTTPQVAFICANDVMGYSTQKFASMPATHSAPFSGTATGTSGITDFSAGSFTVESGNEGVNSTFGTNYYALFGSGTALPIVLEDFQVDCINGQPRISWITATETNNDFFTIERSADGVHFETVGKTKGAGFSNNSRYYYLIDDHSGEKINYYRLKQTDYDGKETYFHMKSLSSCHRLISGVNVNLYPNPFEQEVKYQFELEKTTDIYIEVLDLTGRRIYVEKVAANAGNNLLTLNMQDFSRGMYIFRLYDGQKFREQKITKL